jgi:hypothetical protein
VTPPGKTHPDQQLDAAVMTFSRSAREDVDGHHAIGWGL